MSLEDHAGDIIRKSRMGLGVPPTEVASAGSLAPETLATYEDDGCLPPSIDFNTLSQRLTLDGKKLTEIAQGWEPAPRDLTQWESLAQIRRDDGGMEVNCYLVWDEEAGIAALFDTGWVAAPIKALLDQAGIDLKFLFLTHSHYDHIEALGEVRKLYPNANVFSQIKGAPAAQQVKQGDSFKLGRLEVAVRETPGHAEDGLTFVVTGFPNEQPGIAIVGDAIFAGSIGGAPKHFEQARTKIREEILSLPAQTLICPGHGPVTTVEEELQHNPFFPTKSATL